MEETTDVPQVKGSCRCGRVQFTVHGAPLITSACHCAGCQKMTASAFSLSTMYFAKDFSIEKGEPVIGGLHGSIRHFFCPHCMTWMFTRPEGMEEFVFVRSSLLENFTSYKPFMETCTDEKLPWVQTQAVHSFSKFPPPEAFPELLGKFTQL